jgi:hypothetical protein
MTMPDGSAAPAATLLAPGGSPGAGATAGTSGGFTNLPAGLYLVHFSGGASAHCTTDGLHGYPLPASGASDGTSVAVTVVAGTVTSPVTATCTP